jgi:phenylalanyl-tRNA synthetase beta chain
MKVPLSWLKEYVDVDVTPKELASLLTFSGTEVEGIRTVGGDFAGIVVGEVLTVDRHPNADRLTVCTVKSGTEVLTVVCGAPNVAAGIKVALATIGATLPNGLKIKKAKVRGVESFGMLCAADELGLSEDHSGLMILPQDIKVGTPFAEIAGPPETILELEVTPNRPDCLSMIGIAREVAALLGKPLRVPEVKFKEGARGVKDMAAVTIEDAGGCPRYTARVISGISIGPSPRWMQQRLSNAGVRPINTIVDVTNYVMLECGQPLHAFDYEFLDGRKIVVRRAKSGEKMSTLDGAERAITSEMLMIADAVRPVAVAGVMGGAGSEIRDVTQTVLLESAFFKATTIRKTAKQLALSTESSYRFERGVDIDMVEWASRRAAALMAELAGGEIAAGVVDCYPVKQAPQTVDMRLARLKSLLGIDIAPARVQEIFKALGFTVLKQAGDTMTVGIPAFRVDIDQEADLIEEVSRIHGLDKIPAPAPASRLVPGAEDTATRATINCRENLIGLGLSEIMNYSFVSEKLLNLVGYGKPEARLVLPNPISADHTIMRDSLVPQMIETLGRNLARQAREAALFEMGRVFFKRSDGGLGEEDRLCIGLLGPVGHQGMQKSQSVRDTDMFQWIKGILEALCMANRVPEVSSGGMSFADIVLKPVESPALAAGRSVSVVVGGELCGVMGLVSDRLRDEWRMTGPVAVMELRMAPLIQHLLRVPASKPVCAFPMVDRDVAMVLDEAVNHEIVVKTIRGAAPAELEDIRLFDVYRGDHVGKGRKSLAYALTYRSMERTLRDEEVNTMHDAIKGVLRKELSAEIREG